MTTQPDWRGDYTCEPPPRITVIRDEHDGLVMDRLGPCERCNAQGGSMWRWRHNGATECWTDMDGIGPYAGWVADRGQPDEDAHR